jgi:hypothetical protein
MGRYGPAPETTAPPPPPPSDDLTRWSFRRKFLAVLAGVGMVTAFIFNFLSPTSNGFRKKTTTTISRPAPTSVVPTTARSTTPTTVFSTTVPGGTASR